MSVRFAAARCTARSPIARALARKAVARAANDNADGAAPAESFDATMRAALMHFADRGMGAAQEARALALAAHAGGDRETCDWWLGICRKLDRKAAEAAENSMGRNANIPAID